MTSHCHGFSCCRTQALAACVSVDMAHRLTCSMAARIFLDQESNPYPLHWQMDSYPLDHQGSPGFVFYFVLPEVRGDTNSKGQSSEADAPEPFLLPSAPEVPSTQSTSSAPHPPDISLGAPSPTWRFLCWNQASAHPSYVENSCSDPSPHSRAGTQVKCVP